MLMLNSPAIPRRTAIGHLDPVATATAPPLATIVPLRAAAPPTFVNTTSHVLLVDVTMLVHYHNVLVQLVLLSPQRSNISSAGAPACQMLAEPAPPRGQITGRHVAEPPELVGHTARTASRAAKSTAALQLLSRRAHAARKLTPVAHAIHPVAGTAMSTLAAAGGAIRRLSVIRWRRAPQRRMARSSAAAAQQQRSRPAAEIR